MEHDQRRSRNPKSDLWWEFGEHGEKQESELDSDRDFPEDIFTKITNVNFIATADETYPSDDIPGSLKDGFRKGLITNCPALSWREAELLISGD